MRRVESESVRVVMVMNEEERKTEERDE